MKKLVSIMVCFILLCSCIFASGSQESASAQTNENGLEKRTISIAVLDYVTDEEFQNPFHQFFKGARFTDSAVTYDINHVTVPRNRQTMRDYDGCFQI